MEKLTRAVLMCGSDDVSERRGGILFRAVRYFGGAEALKRAPYLGLIMWLMRLVMYRVVKEHQSRQGVQITVASILHVS